ncbi:MAG TPA: oligosaccharide flippase family protein [Solirubrobacteraceae bacterium]|jgi:O-antigen/teichoic acid export membrane protein|nr:oligosaccharide flippase family protein [Solirubrobacteraceae bacterium]
MPELGPLDPAAQASATSAEAAHVDPGGAAIRGSALRIASYGFGVGISLGSAVILVRHLGIVHFGQFITVSSLIALVGGVTEAGIVAFGIREATGLGAPARASLISDLLGLRLALTLAGVAWAALFALIAGYPGVLVIGTLLAGVGLVTQVVADVLGIPLQVELRLGRLALVDIARRAAALALIGLLALLGSALFPFFAVAGVSGVVALAVLARVAGASLVRRLTFDRRRWWAMFSEAVPFAIAVSIGAIYFYVTVIVMSLIASGVQTGLFATSFRIVQVALAVPAIALTSVFPLIASASQNSTGGSRAAFGKVFDVAVIFGTWLSISTALGAPFIVDLVAGSAGHGAVEVLRIQGIALTMSFVSASSMFGLLSLRRYRPLLVSTMSALAFNVALALALIPSNGARGGAIADVVTETLVAVGVTISLTRAQPDHGIGLAVPSRVLLAAGASLVALLLPGSVARVAVATLVYFVVLYLVGAIPTELTQFGARLRGRGARI